MALPQPLTLWYPHSFAVVETECERSSATTYFWYREALDISNSISESGGLNWKMTLCLLVAWSLVGLAMIKGIQSSGKVGSSNLSSRCVGFLPCSEGTHLQMCQMFYRAHQRVAQGKEAAAPWQWGGITSSVPGRKPHSHNWDTGREPHAGNQWCWEVVGMQSCSSPGLMGHQQFGSSL